MALRGAVILALTMALGGCGGAVEGWRSVMGYNVNDPDPQTAPFTGNMAGSEAAPYPNLADVPPPPTRATTAAERQKLAQSLVADRDATEARGALPAGAATTSSARGGTAAAPETQRIAANSPQANAAPGAGQRRIEEPPQPLGQDSDLTMPQVRSLPEPDAPRPALPAPGLASLPRPALAAPPPPVEAAAMPAPAPAPPALVPIEPPAGPIRSEPKRPTTVATLEMTAGQDRAEIERVAAAYKAAPGALRVVGYAAAPSAGGDPFGSYRAVLERTQAIAKALADAGIPAGKIQTEAAPAAAGRASGRIEIQFVP